MTHDTPDNTKTTYPTVLAVISVVGGIWRQLKEEEEEEEVEEEERRRRRRGEGGTFRAVKSQSEVQK